MSGNVIALIGAGLCAALCGCGSAWGVMSAGRAAAGVTSEKPDLFGKLIILEALPGTQGIYGFLVAILVLAKVNAGITADQGLALLAATLPMTVVGFLSAIAQSKAAVAAIHMTGKQPDSSGKGITITAMVETYAIIALLASILLLTKV